MTWMARCKRSARPWSVIPQHVAARAAVERLINSPAHAVAALELLEPLAEQERDFGKLVELLEVRVGVTQGKPERAAVCSSAWPAWPSESCPIHSRAFDAVARAFIETPDETRLTDEMERLAKSAVATVMPLNAGAGAGEDGVWHEVGQSTSRQSRACSVSWGYAPPASGSV
jgi:hypothetical protein